MSDETIYSEYCFNRMMHLNTPATIRDGKCFRVIEDTLLIHEKDFKKLYPLKIRPRLRQLQNIDNTKKWML